MRGRVFYSLYDSVRAVMWSITYVCTKRETQSISKCHVLHKQLLHYSTGSRILSLSYSSFGVTIDGITTILSISHVNTKHSYIYNYYI